MFNKKHLNLVKLAKKNTQKYCQKKISKNNL